MMTDAGFSSLPNPDSSRLDHSMFASCHSKPAFPYLSTSCQYQASRLSSSPGPHSQLQNKDNSCLSLVKGGKYCCHVALQSLLRHLPASSHLPVCVLFVCLSSLRLQDWLSTVTRTDTTKSIPNYSMNQKLWLTTVIMFS